VGGPGPEGEGTLKGILSVARVRNEGRKSGVGRDIKRVSREDIGGRTGTGWGVKRSGEKQVSWGRKSGEARVNRRFHAGGWHIGSIVRGERSCDRR